MIILSSFTQRRTDITKCPCSTAAVSYVNHSALFIIYLVILTCLIVPNVV